MSHGLIERQYDRRQQSRRQEYTKEPAGIIYRRYVIARLYVVLSIITTLIIAIFQPGSIYVNSIKQLVPEENMFVLGIVAIISIATILDIIVNDFMPNKYRIMFLYNKRHLFFMSLAMGMYSMAAEIILTEQSSFVLLRLWLDGFIAAIVAVLDIFARHGRGFLWQSGR